MNEKERAMVLVIALATLVPIIRSAYRTASVGLEDAPLRFKLPTFLQQEIRVCVVVIHLLLRAIQ